MPHRFPGHLLLLPLLMLLASCGNRDTFTITALVQGLGDGGVEMVWDYNGIQRVEGHAVNGKVKLVGVAPEPVLVDVFTLNHELLFTLVARNGDDIKLRMVQFQPSSIEVKGSKPNELMAQWLRDNDAKLRSGDVAALNASIARLVHDNPSSTGAAALLVFQFDTRGYELMADSLLHLLSEDARPLSLVQDFGSVVATQASAAARGRFPSLTVHTGRDTVVRIMPTRQRFALIAFTTTRRGDSVYRALKQLADSGMSRRKIQVVELTLGCDSGAWRRAIRGDSARWQQGWLPGGTGNPAIRQLAIPRLPYFVVIDSTGIQTYHGQSITQALKRL